MYFHIPSLKPDTPDQFFYEFIQLTNTGKRKPLLKRI